MTKWTKHISKRWIKMVNIKYSISIKRGEQIIFLVDWIVQNSKDIIEYYESYLKNPECSWLKRCDRKKPRWCIFYQIRLVYFSLFKRDRCLSMRNSPCKDMNEARHIIVSESGGSSVIIWYVFFWVWQRPLVKPVMIFDTADTFVATATRRCVGFLFVLISISTGTRND